jgi:ribosomal-protein-alanine N-acetyltransferase
VNSAASRVVVRRLTAADIGAVLAIQALSPEASQWSRDGYARAAAGEFGAWVSEADQRVTGFLVLRTVPVEAEILNLAVEPRNRRQGTARALLGAALEASRAAGVKLLFLEVRESNSGAIGFYQLNGFQVSGRRPRYYHDPPEDALVLSRSVE